MHSKARTTVPSRSLLEELLSFAVKQENGASMRQRHNPVTQSVAANGHQMGVVRNGRKNLYLTREETTHLTALRSNIDQSDGERGSRVTTKEKKGLVERGSQHVDSWREFRLRTSGRQKKRMELWSKTQR